MVSLSCVLVVILLMLCCYSYGLHLPKSQWKKRVRRMTSSSVESLSILSSAENVDYILETIRVIGPGALPLAAVAIYTLAVNNQVGIIERTTNNEIKSAKDTINANRVENDRQIKAMHDSTDIKIKANKEENDKQISVMKELVKANKEENDKQILVIKELVKANKEENDKQISVMKELVNIQINAMNKISEQTTKASESKIESILMRFTAQNYNQNYNRSGDEN